MNARIRPETSEDRESVRHVNQQAFGGDDEANLVDVLREEGFTEVSLVAEIEGQVVGHILFSRVTIMTTSGTEGALALAPMAVLPCHQRQGIGSKLVELGLNACRERGHAIVVVLGHPEYYPRFGFSAERARKLESPFGGGEAWMVLELVSDALSGIEGRIEYSPPFRDLG